MRRQLQRGADVIKGIIGDNEYDGIVFPSRMKLVFSTVEPKSEGITSLYGLSKSILEEEATVRANGVLIKGKLYQFTPRYQELFHRGVLQTFVKDSMIPEDVITQFMDFHHSWKEDFLANSRVRFYRQLRTEQASKIKEIRYEASKAFKGVLRAEYNQVFLDRYYPGLTWQQYTEIVDAYKKYRDDCQRAKIDGSRRKEGLVTGGVPKNSKLKSKTNAVPKKRTREDLEREKEEAVLRRAKRAEQSAIIDQEVQARLETLLYNFENGVQRKYGVSFSYEAYKIGTDGIFREAFEKHLVDDDLMTADELSDYKTMNARCSSIVQRAIKIIHQKVEESGNIVIFPRESINCETHRLVPVEGSRYKDNKYDGQVHSLFSKIKKVIRKEGGVTYYESPHDLDLRIKEFNNCATIKGNLVDIKEYFDNFMGALFRGDTDTLNSIYVEFTTVCENYYNDLLIRHREAYNVWGSISSSEKRKVSYTVAAAKEKFEEEFEEKLEQLSEQELDEITKKLVDVFIDSNTSISDVIMLPTGLLVGFLEGKIDVVGYSPIDPKIRKILSEDQWRDWQHAWAKFYRDNIETFDVAIRKLMNHFVQTHTENNIDYLPEAEQRLYHLCSKYNIDIPLAIDSTSGRFTVPISDNAIAAMEEIFPSHNRYINSIITSRNRMSAAEISGIVKDIMGGKQGMHVYPFVYQSKNGYAIDVNILGNIFEDVDGNEIRTLVSAVIAIQSYSALTHDTIIEFNNLVADQLSVSKISFFRFSGKRIDSPIERKQHMSRIIFVTEYTKHILGEQSNLTGFFSARVDKT